jgi:acyl dehydratase
VTVEAVQPSRSRLDRGILRLLMETLNQEREVVLSMRAMLLLRRGPGLDA